MARTGTRYFGDEEDDELSTLQSLLQSSGSQPARANFVDLPELTITADKPDDEPQMELQPDRAPLDHMQLDPDIAPEDHTLMKLSQLDGADDMGPMPSASDRAAERRQIDREGGGALGDVARGIGSVVPDIGTIAALGLDAGFNRGRGAGEIVGAYANNKAAAAAKQKDPFEQLVALERLKQGQQRIEGSAEDRGRKDKQLGLQTDKWGQAIDPDSAANTSKVETARRRTEATTKEGIETRNELKDTSADTAATIAQAGGKARTDAVTDALRDNPREITAQQQVSNDLAQTKLDLAAEKETREKNEENVRWSGDFTKKTQDMIKIAQAARKLDEIFGKHGEKDDIPGIGSMESYLPDWALGAGNKLGVYSDDQKKEADEIRTLQASLRSFEGKEITGAAAGGKEESGRIGRLAGTAGGMDEAQVRGATKQLRQTAEQAIKLAASGRPDLAKQILAESGLDDILGDGGPAAAAPPKKSAAMRQKLNSQRGVRSVDNPDSWAPLSEGDENDVYRRWR